MIAGTGIDIVEVRRIEKAITKNGDKFINKIFTEAEVKYCSKMKYPYTHYALRFAAKEAFLKAAGTGIGPLSMNEIELVNANDGSSPYLVFHGSAKAWMLSHKVQNVWF